MHSEDHVVNAIGELLAGAITVGVVGAALYSLVLFTLWVFRR